LLRREFVLGRGSLDFLELQFHLIKKTRRTFRALAVNLATKLLDLELKIGDQRFMAGAIGLRFGGLGARVVKVGASARQFAFRRKPRRPLGQDHRMRGGKI
jgi:hypothetical protein